MRIDFLRAAIPLSGLRRGSDLLIWLICVGLFVQLSGIVYTNDGSRYSTQVYLLFFLPALVFAILNRYSFQVLAHVDLFVFLLLLSWVFWVSFFYDDSVKSSFYWAKVLFLIALYVLVVSLLSSNLNSRLRSVLFCSLICVLFFAWATILHNFFVLNYRLDYDFLRVNRFYTLGWKGFADLDHPIIAGLYYGVFSIVALWFYLEGKLTAYKILFFTFAMAGLLFYVLLTFSRGAWFSVGAAGLFLLLITNTRRSWILVILGSVSLLVIFFTFYTQLVNEHDIGVNGRDLIWNYYFSVLDNFWLWGAGAGTEFYFKFPNGFEVIHAHSLYLQLWYEYGILGISLFVALLLSLLWKGWQCREQPIARLGLALLVFAMVAMISDVYAVFHRPSPYWVIFWFPVGILLGVQRKPVASLG